MFIADLLEPREPHGGHRLDQRAAELGTVLSVLAQHGGDKHEAHPAFLADIRRLGLAQPPSFAPSLQWVRPLDRALASLESLQPVAKQALIEAMVATVNDDRTESHAEVELVRTIAASLHCPLPRTA